MSTTKSEKLPAVYSGLSPRGAPGVYRHAIRTRFWPKTWSQDTQSASSGTLFIQSPKDRSSDFRQELWSYQGENRGASRSGTHQLPQIPYRFRSSFEFDGQESERADGSQPTEGKNLPNIHPSTKQCRRRQNLESQLESSASITHVITSVEKENALTHSKTNTPDLSIQSIRNHKSRDAKAISNVEFQSKNVMAPKSNTASRPINVQQMTSTLFRDSHSLYVPKMINVTSTRFGALRRFKSEERLAADARKRLQWEAERYLGKLPGQPQESDGRALISIVGKLPTVRKGMLKTLQTLQKEKYCGEKHADVSQSKALEGLMLGPEEENVTLPGDHIAHPGIQEEHPGNTKNSEKLTNEVIAIQGGKTADGAALALDRHLQGHHLKLNPPKMHTSGKGSDGSPTDAKKAKTENTKQSENTPDEEQNISDERKENEPQELRQLSKEPTGDLKQDVKWVQNTTDTSAIIDSGGYSAFARTSPHTSEQKTSEKGDNNIDSAENTEEDFTVHVSHSQFGNSKCYPKFSSDDFSPEKNGALKSPRKLSKLKKRI